MARNIVLIASVCMVLLVPTAADAAVLGFWSFDDQTVTDLTGRNSSTYNAGSGSGLAFAPTVDGYALDLRGNPGWVETGIAMDGGSKTVVATIQSGMTADHIWFGNPAPTSNRFYLGVRGSARTGMVYVALGTSYTPTNLPIDWAGTSASTYYDYALVCEAGNVNTGTAYQDGVAQYSMSYGGSPATDSGSSFQIGSAGGGGDGYANALIDEIAVFDTELSQAALGHISADGIQSYLNATRGNVVYREQFPNSMGSPDHWNLTGASKSGWNISLDAGSTHNSSSVSASVGADPRNAPVASNPAYAAEANGQYDHGYVYVGSVTGTQKDMLYWTEEFAVDDVAKLTGVSWFQNNGSPNDVMHVALRLDTGTAGDTSDDTWYVSSASFDSDYANETSLEYYSAQNNSGIWAFNQLRIDDESAWEILGWDGTTLALTGTTGDLPASMAVSGFGLYTPNVSDGQRIDSFTIYVPEPSSFLLYLAGLLAGLLVLRRRQR